MKKGYARIGTENGPVELNAEEIAQLDAASDGF